MKRELGYIYREPQIILQRAACDSRAAGCPPWNILYCATITFLRLLPRSEHIPNALLQDSYFYNDL